MRTTVTLADGHVEHLDSIRESEEEPDAAVVRRCVERSQRLTAAEQRIDDLETELRHTEAELDEANKRLREAHSRIETTNELVQKVDSDLSARERRERREERKDQAGVLTRAKWWLVGMDDGED